MRTMLLPLICFACAAAAQAEIVKPKAWQEYEIVSMLMKADLATDPDRNPDYGKIKTALEDLEIAMGVRTNDKERKLLRGPMAEDFEKLNGFWRDRRGEYIQAEAKYKAHHRKADGYRQEAVNLTTKYYNIQPASKSNKIINGPSEHRGRTFDWKPTFVATLPAHLARMARETGDEVLGRTDPANNRIEIYPAALNSIGKLAAAVRHEEIHYMAYGMSPDKWDMRNEPEDEEVIVRMIMENQAEFGLYPYDYTQNLLKWAYSEELAQKWEQAMESCSPSEKHLCDPDKNPGRFAEIALSDERKLKIYTTLQQDLLLFQSREAVLGEVSENDIESLREKASSDFIKGLSDKQFLAVVRGWKISRDALANREKNIENLVMAGIEWEAKRCGFVFVREGNRGVGFKQDQAPRHEFRYNRGMDLDSVKVSMFFANACIGAHGYQKEPGPACNDALDIVGMRWNDPAFREKVDLWSTRDMVECVAYLRENIRLPTDPVGFRRVVLEARAEYDRRWSGGRGGSPGGQEPGAQRPPATGDGSERDRGGLDFSRAKEALEKARGVAPK
ncbi:MAG: hypothetical protein HY748_14460 [Elusimicrobia bacterium]|nr:hypothetical protein [Elusimicrobiota bacterium]